MLSVLMLLVLAGCGGTTTTPTAATTAPTTGAAATTAPTTAPTNPLVTTSTPTAEERATEVPSAGGQTLTIYSGRSEELVGPLIEQFEQQSGIDVQVKYGGTAELAATLMEEGERSPADVFFAQDAGALGAVSGMLSPLPADVLSQVDERFHADNGMWTGVSGRARVAAYNPEKVQEADMPASIKDFTDPQWKGRLGWAPTNGSFQAFVTALRVLEGEDVAKAWLEGIKANEPKVYAGNGAVLEAVAAGEIDVGFINHYYLMQTMAERGDDYNARNYFFKGGDIGALINVAGVGVLNSSQNQDAALAFVNFLLSEEAQTYFKDKTFEYPLAAGVQPNEKLPALADIQTPEIDLSNLEDLEGTLSLLYDTGVLE